MVFALTGIEGLEVLLMRRAFRAWLACSLALLAGWSISAQAQTFQGSFSGTVTDATGAVIPGATVSAVELGKGFSRSAVTLDDGTYEIALLPPGHYRLTAAKEGFEKTTQGSLDLTVNQHQKVDFLMKVGAQTTTVTVEAAPAVVDTQSSSVGTTIEQAKVDQVPLNGRNFLELTLLAPGVVPGTSGSRISDRGGAINVNGMRESMNSYWLDGLDNTSTGVGQFTVAPPVDSVQEFRMETGVYEAKFGAHAGAQVNVVTKSGTNEFHGTLHEFFRNSALDATNFFEPSVPPFRRNQFGGTVGGPIDLPGVYDGHDRSFFFFAFEGLRERRSFFNRARVPTLAERSGDFTDLLAPDCNPQTVLLNPVLLLTGSGSPTFTNINQVFPQADPVGQALVNLYPQPNVSNARCGAVNYVAQVNRKIDTDTYVGRVDHRWGSKDNIFFRYNLTRDHEFLPSGPTAPVGTGTSVPGFGTFLPNAFQMAGMDWTHIFTPTLINELKLGYNRWQHRQKNEDQGRLIAQQLGIQGLSTSDPQRTGVPNLTFAGYDSLGADTVTPQAGAVNTFQIADTLTHVHVNHSLAYGFDIRTVRRGNFGIDNIIRGQFDFTGLVTGGLVLQSLPPTLQQPLLQQCPPPSCAFVGNPVADALLGLPTDWIKGFQQYLSGYFGEYDFFGQDTWKARRNLTLNFGIRYEYKGLTTDKADHFANFDFNKGLLLVAGRSSATLENFDPTTGLYVPVGTESLGGAAENRSLQHPDRNNFAPRFGFAWQPFGDSRTVVRGAYGVFYDQTFGDVYFQKSSNPPFVRINLGNVGAALPLLQMGFFTPDSGAVIQKALTGAVGPVFPTTSPFEINFDDSFIQEWAFNVQRELPGSWLVDVGYLGTRGLHLPRETDPNQPNNSNPALCSAGCPRRFPNFSGFSYTESSGSSIYHAFQAKVEKRYSRGLAFLGAYTWSKSIDTNSSPFGTDRNENFPQNSRSLAAEKALSDFDFRHRLSLAYVYDLPVGNTLWKLQSSRLNYLIEGWEVSGIVTAQSGAHFTPNISGNLSGADESQTSGTGHPTDRPNLAGSGFYPTKQTSDQWVLASAFSAPAPFTFGNAGRNILIGPGLGSWDFSVIRKFRLAETKTLEFRAEMFNIFSRANFDIPKRDVASPSFGKIFNTVQPLAGLASGGPGDPREVQFGLKLIW